MQYRRNSKLGRWLWFRLSSYGFVRKRRQISPVLSKIQTFSSAVVVVVVTTTAFSFGSHFSFLFTTHFLKTLPKTLAVKLSVWFFLFLVVATAAVTEIWKLGFESYRRRKVGDSWRRHAAGRAQLPWGDAFASAKKLAVLVMSLPRQLLPLVGKVREGVDTF